MSTLAWLVLFLLIAGTVAFVRAPLQVATAAIGGYLVALTLWGGPHWFWAVLFWLAFIPTAVVLNVEPLRRQFVTDRLFGWFRQALPGISDTEREALDAGTVWWDGELFSGRPNWRTLHNYPKPALTDEERAFIDGPVEELCRMVDEWDVTHHRFDLPPEAWQYIKDQGFFGLIIPKEYGGKGFTAMAHSEIVMKLSTRASDLGSTVMVPNSLGPAELLMRYGTDDQRNYYLPRLAKGQEIPCFGLTGPEAGSDASSIPDTGVVCKGEFNGEEVLGLRLNWEKRYITLGPVATVLGLAFKAYDPDHLLGNDEELGITLALIPTDTPGVKIGRRHFPLNAAFQNGPNWGEDVFIPMSYIIGGQERIGEGWKMLMNCLSVGRSISLPSGGASGSKFAAMVTGAYARVRKQFRVPVGEFEGVQEALARIGANAYVTDAARCMTAGAVDLGEEPAVISGIVKYHNTERMRQSVIDAMDVHGGKGICLGPNNYLGRGYQTAPIPITVEGSNILTRNMIIFGQGAIRCHPYVLKEMLAAQNPDTTAAKETFDELLTGHVGFTISNAVRALALGLTDGRGLSVPGSRATRRYYQQLSRAAAAFALVADFAMLTLGGSLKRKERISARLGDVLSYLYLSSAVLKRFEDDGRPEADLPLVRYALEDALQVIDQRLYSVLDNFPMRPLALSLRALIFPLGRRHHGPTDAQERAVAKLLMEPSESRERLLRGVYRSEDQDQAVGKLEYALRQVVETAELEGKLSGAIKSGRVKPHWREDVLDTATEAGVLTKGEADQLREARRATRAVIDVDDFDAETLAREAG